MHPSIELLRGHALLNGAGQAAEVVPFSVESLPKEPVARFRALFAARPEWKIDDLNPYLDGLQVGWSALVPGLCQRGIDMRISSMPIACMSKHCLQVITLMMELQQSAMTPLDTFIARTISENVSLANSLLKLALVSDSPALRKSADAQFLVAAMAKLARGLCKCLTLACMKQTQRLQAKTVCFSVEMSCLASGIADAMVKCAITP